MFDVMYTVLDMYTFVLRFDGSIVAAVRWSNTELVCNLKKTRGGGVHVILATKKSIN